MFRFSKRERISSLKEIESLFERGRSSSVQCMPLRAVWQTCSYQHTVLPTAEPAIKVLMSVAKKRLRHAVDRNRAKRQMREAYRLYHWQLTEAVAECGLQLHIAFVWQSEEPEPTEHVFEAMRCLLETIGERVKR
ncbi:MAG: ribonuclease P protein component [Bacteroidaceae bacterium]|nr:ribonuclease P protein component [Bacteroidaceae bacterium]MBP5731188.1 ribonuclease P protein component [Bacteroidaceae bacterium]